MEYEERTFDCAHKKEVPPDMSMYAKMGALPLFLIKWLFKKNISKIREAMGGNSKDITIQTINSEDRNISGYHSPFRIRIYKPEIQKDNRPLIMFYHGGGWIGGSLGAVEDFCTAIADQADSVVISVDYHLAPEHPYPEGLEDSYCAIKWAVDHAKELGVNVNKIVTAGDSAGGNFATILTFMAKERQEFKIDKQILIYPATNLVEESSEKQKNQIKGWDKISRAMMRLYVKNPKDAKNPYVSPMLSPSFEQMPPALLTVGDQDFLLDSVKKYAELLDRAKNKVKLIVYKDTNHAFIDNTGNCLEANNFIKEAVSFIKS